MSPQYSRSEWTSRLFAQTRQWVRLAVHNFSKAFEGQSVIKARFWRSNTYQLGWYLYTASRCIPHRVRSEIDHRNLRLVDRSDSVTERLHAATAARQMNGLVSVGNFVIMLISNDNCAEFRQGESCGAARKIESAELLNLDGRVT
jgi:hypothetical protein